MFAQFFVFIIAVISLVLGLLEGDYLWALAGVVGILSGIHLVYQVRTGRSIWDGENTKQ